MERDIVHVITTTRHRILFRFAHFVLFFVMAPVYVKGGVWTNVEDEILKAAVQKYGLQQWLRVASLLTKKSAAQAKARWNEWINPTINKTEWTRQQDEKLLRLVRLMPNQWRSIAPLVGRTATHCVERYQWLLEQGEQDGDNDGNNYHELGITGSGIEALPAAGSTVGDLNINPESKPARPDSAELEDADREMLFEARARLANTKGKKAKRRDRERMLEETKRVSLVQKRREMKAAGINVSLVSKLKKKGKEFDYIGDIPFEHQPTVGLYDTTEEEKRGQKAGETFERSVQKEGVELEIRKEKKRKQAIVDAEKGKGNHDSVEGEAEIVELPVSKRTKFNMPQVEAVDDMEMEASTELAGVFDKHSSTVKPNDDVDARIQKSLIDIQQAQARPSAFIDQTVPATAVLGELRIKPKKEKKMILEVLKTCLSGLPSPKNELEVLPQFDQQEDIILTKSIATAQEKQQQERLLLLREVDEAKRQLRRSQVMQRDLPIPDPLLLKPIESTISGLDKAIADEFAALIRADYQQYVQGGDGTNELGLLDEEAYDAAVARVQDELAALRAATVVPEPDVPLATDKFAMVSPSEAEIPAIRTAIATTRKASLERAHELSHELAQKLVPSSSIPEITENFRATAQDLTQQHADWRLYTTIAAVEDRAITTRSARLNSRLQPLIDVQNLLDSHLRGL